MLHFNKYNIFRVNYFQVELKNCRFTMKYDYIYINEQIRLNHNITLTIQMYYYMGLKRVIINV